MKAKGIPDELIGNLLDHWEGLPNDLVSDLESGHVGFYRAVKQLQKWIEDNR